jgi:hypothetical protein
MPSKHASTMYNHYRGTQFDALFVAEQWRSTPAVFSALKYLQRSGLKDGADPIEDMTKAAWYIVYEAARLADLPPEKRRMLADKVASSLREDCSCPIPTDAMPG